MMNKKGIEQPQVIVYVIFVIVLTIAGIYVAFTKLGGVTVTFEFHDYAARLNVVSTKLMFTPECYAIENSYLGKDGSKHYQISSGVINWTLFNKTNIISSKCLSGEKQVWAELSFFGTNNRDSIWSCPSSSTCSEPLERDRADADVWNQMRRSFFVLIQNGTRTEEGVLTVQLKE